MPCLSKMARIKRGSLNPQKKVKDSLEDPGLNNNRSHDIDFTEEVGLVKNNANDLANYD